MNKTTINNAQEIRTLILACKSHKAPSALRREIVAIVMGLFAMIVVAGCASTKVTEREQYVTGQLPRPANIWVYSFAATASDLPANSAFANQPDLDTTPQTSEQIAEGRRLGDEIAAQLVELIRDMGMPATQAWTSITPQINDIVIRGYLLSVQEGSSGKRFIIGFGSGESELKTVVEGFQVTGQGLRKLGSGTVEASGSKAPGTALGVAALIATGNPAGLIISGGMHIYGEKSGRSKVEGRAKATAKEIADVLKERFKEQGWIN